MEFDNMIFMLLPLTLVVGALVLVAYWIAGRQRARDYAHRERMAMIDKGIAPPPETAARTSLGPGVRPAKVERSRSMGVMLIGLGLGLGTLLTFTAGVQDVGVGIGGAIALVGAAFVVNSYLCCQPGPPALPGDDNRS